MKLTTLITEPKDYSEKALAIYRSLGPVYFVSPAEALTKAGSKFKTADILVVGLRHQIDKKWIDAMPKLKVVASPATGLNHLDYKYLHQKGIKLISLRGRRGFLKNVPSTAEETVALLLALMRRLPWAFEDVKSGHWDRIKWRGHQLYQKILGLVGFGRLGRIVARYAKAFNMSVLAYDPYVSGGLMRRYGVKKTKLDDLLCMADIVSLHVLLTDGTQNLITEKHLKMMKPSAYLVNTARGELIKRGALEKALKNKWIAGAALDVMWDEAGDGSHLKNNPLVEYAKKNRNLIIVPHIGGATFEAMQVTQDYIAELVKKYFKKHGNA